MALLLLAGAASAAAERTGQLDEAADTYDAVRVVRRALGHHAGVQIAQLQYAAALAKSVEHRAALRPALTVDARPYWLETWIPDASVLPELQDPSDLMQQSRWMMEMMEHLLGGLPERLAEGHGYTVELTGRVSLWKSPLQRALETVAAAEERQADAELEAAVGRAIVQSLEAYYGVLRAEAALHLAELALEEATLRAEEIAARRLEGTATAVDELQVEAERLQAEARVIQARGEAAASRMGLNQALGFPADTRLNVVEMDIPAAWPALEEALQLAARRADVQRAHDDLEKARAAAVIAREQAAMGVRLFGQYRWPDAELSAGVDRQGYLGGTVTHNRVYLEDEAQPGEAESWTVGIEVSWPIFDGGQRRAQVRQAELQAEQAALAARQIEQTAATEVTAAHARLEAAAQALDGARRAVAAAQEALRVATELAAAGAATERDVVRARLAVGQAELGRLEATYTFTLAQAAYLQSAGVLLSHWLSLAGLDHLLVQWP